MGTALITRGLLPGAFPEEWIIQRPSEIAAVHAEHAAAGAEILLTCTFNCAAPRLESRLDPALLYKVCAAAVRLAREASRPGGLVAGAVGPTGLHRPGDATHDELVARYRRPLAALAGTGVDLLWIESQWELREALAALEAALETRLPTVVTFGFPESARAFRAPDGSAAEATLAAVQAAGATAVGVNCVAPGPALTALARTAAAKLAVPFVAKPTAGLPGAVLSPDAFAAAVEPALAAGLRVVGGCCGATGAHVAALAERLRRAAGPGP
jgi:5-methyltetrahydrofolate--homocysteine methyltransferase